MPDIVEGPENSSPSILSGLVSDDSSLPTNVVILALNKSCFRNKKTIDQRTISPNDVDPRWLNAGKKLIESEALSRIYTLFARLDQSITNLAVPTRFLNRGLYIIPVALIPQVEETIDGVRGGLDVLVGELVDSYDEAVESAKGRLGSLYDPRDYVAKESLPSLFSIKHSYANMSVPGNLKEVSKELEERERQKHVAMWQEAVDEVRSALRDGMKDLLDKLVDSLAPGEGEKKRFSTSHMSNLSEFLELFEHKNIGGDKELEDIVSQAKLVLNGVDPKHIGKKKDGRAELARSFKELSDKISNLDTQEYRRRIEFDDEAA